MVVVELESWADFREWIAKHREIQATYWRGQASAAWPLASSFERTILDAFGGRLPGASRTYPYGGRYQRNGRPVWDAGFYQGSRDRYLMAFKRFCEGLRGPNPANLSEDQWWALGRHHGLTTPLLDWSRSPYIAAFFALSEFLRARHSASVTGLTFTSQKSIAVYQLFHNDQLEEGSLRVVRSAVEELGRLHGQRGVFTWLDSEEHFELQGYLDHVGRGDLLTQLLLPEHAVLDGLQDLHEHGIDHRLLFPDLAGAAMAANAYFDLPHFLR